MIKVKFKEKDYINLMKLIYCGNWFINAIRSNDNIIKKYDEIKDKIFSQAPSDLKNLVKYDKESKKYLPSCEFEEKMEEFVDAYDDYVFWEELVLRLGKRDIALKYENKADEFRKLLMEERWEENNKEEEKYSEEFEKHGLERLKIDYNAPTFKDEISRIVESEN